MTEQIGLTGTPVTLQEVLDNREHRVAQQKKLREQYGCAVLSFTMNMPGPIKQHAISQAAYLRGRVMLLDALRHAGYEVSGMLRAEGGNTGPEALYAVKADPLALKRLACSIEDATPLGRLFDLDVLAPDGTAISRTQLGMERRRCLLCEEESAVCARSRAHRVEELLERIVQIATEANLV